MIVYESAYPALAWAVARAEAKRRRLPVYSQVLYHAAPDFQPEPGKTHVYVSYVTRSGVTAYRVHVPTEVS